MKAQAQVKINKMFEGKIVNIFLPISFNIYFGNGLVEAVLLSAHNICFGREIRKIFFCYALLNKVLGSGQNLNLYPHLIAALYVCMTMLFVTFYHHSTVICTMLYQLLGGGGGGGGALIVHSVQSLHYTVQKLFLSFL